jgi:hypothetical protein
MLLQQSVLSNLLSGVIYRRGCVFHSDLELDQIITLLLLRSALTLCECEGEKDLFS